MPKSTASRLLNQMQHYGMLDQDAASRRYRPGLLLSPAVRAGLAATPLDDACRKVLARLSADSGLTAYLSTLNQRETVVLQRLNGSHPVQVLSPDVYKRQMVVFPDAVSALSGVQAGRADAYAATALTVNDLMGKTNDGSGLEKAEPFTDPVIDGKGVRGYGAYAFRTDDKAFADAFNAELAKFIGTDEHKKLVAPFGFTPEELPKDVTAAKLCAGQ